VGDFKQTRVKDGGLVSAKAKAGVNKGSFASRQHPESDRAREGKAVNKLVKEWFKQVPDEARPAALKILDELSTLATYDRMERITARYVQKHHMYISDTTNRLKARHLSLLQCRLQAEQHANGGYLVEAAPKVVYIQSFATETTSRFVDALHEVEPEMANLWGPEIAGEHQEMSTDDFCSALARDVSHHHQGKIHETLFDRKPSTRMFSLMDEAARQPGATPESVLLAGQAEGSRHKFDEDDLQHFARTRFVLDELLGSQPDDVEKMSSAAYLRWSKVKTAEIISRRGAGGSEG